MNTPKHAPFRSLSLCFPLALLHAASGCIDAAFRSGTDGFGPYRACSGEPFAGSNIDIQIASAIEMARSPNDLAIDCTGGGGNAAHTHGYSHGANDQPNAILACGYAGDPSWHFQVNTAPYIIGNCVAQVMSDSARGAARARRLAAIVTLRRRPPPRPPASPAWHRRTRGP